MISRDRGSSQTVQQINTGEYGALFFWSRDGFASIASRTLARRKQEGKLQRAESEKVFRLASLFDRTVEVLGDHGRARSWIKTENRALGGKSPLEYADTEIGAREVEDLLGRLEHGAFS